MDTNFNKLDKKIWDQLERNQWPIELADIKPKRWDGMDHSQKGKVVLENLGQIIYQVTLLTNIPIGISQDDIAQHDKQQAGKETTDQQYAQLLHSGHFYP